MISTQRLFFIFSLLVSSVLFADGSLQTSIHHQYQSPRPLGMGDAFVAVANDYNALLYNPAGLARLEEGEINLSLDAAFSSSFQKFATDVTNTGKITGTESQKIAAYQALLQGVYGKQFSSRVGLLEGVWVRPHFGMAVLPSDLSLDLVVHNTVGPSIDVRAYLDTTIAFGYGKDFKGVPGRLSWGVTGKFINRGFASKQILPLDLAADSTIIKSTDLQEGYTTDADVGILYTPFLPSDGFMSIFRLAKPTFGVVVRNIGEVGFSKSLKLLNKEKTEAPEKLYRVLDVGAKFEYPNFWIFSGRGAVDVRDIGHPSFSVKKGFHLGVEFDWRLFSWWKGSYRLGVNQNYPTAGISALFSFFNIDLVTYGEDVGTYDTAKENRMYMLKLNINL